MTRMTVLAGLVVATGLALAERRAAAQAMLADDIIILSKGQRAKEKAKADTHLGGTSGTGAGPFGFSPGTGAARLGERSGPAVPSAAAMPRSAGVLSAASGYEAGTIVQRGPSQITPPAPLPGREAPTFGLLEVPGGEEEGPPNGLTLDLAIDRLVHANPDLGTKFQEIPKAEADTLTAGLRANPLVFASADSVPYGGYSPQRPGNNAYTVVLIQPIDVNQKRQVRVLVAQQARKVLEAQYQNAVRLAIDDLSSAFVDVLDAREVVRYKRASLARLGDLLKVTREQQQKGFQPESEVDRVTIQRDTAEVELDAALAALADAKRVLATLLNLPPAEVAPLEVRGTIRDRAAPPPPVADLVRLALCNRPDVVAYRLGVHRAEADVRLARAERFEDVFLLYTPYGFTNYAWEGQKSATSWSVGVLVSLPLINRNQGNIARAQHTVLQSRIELTGLERQVISEVERAGQAYGTTLAAVQRLEQSILPRAKHLRDDKFRLYAEGQEDITVYYNAERDYSEVVRQYRDTLIRHRRSMLRLNTAVGQRILP